DGLAVDRSGGDGAGDCGVAGRRNAEFARAAKLEVDQVAGGAGVGVVHRKHHGRGLARAQRKLAEGGGGGGGDVLDGVDDAAGGGEVGGVEVGDALLRGGGVVDGDGGAGAGGVGQREGAGQAVECSHADCARAGTPL